MDEVKQAIARGIPVGQAIRAALLARGLTVKALAEQNGLSRPTLTDVVNSVRKPSPAQLKALQKALGGKREEWLELLWLGGRPDHMAKAS